MQEGVQTNLNLDELADLSIPILPMEIQELITEKIQESFNLKTQSEGLLNKAKRAVEMAIEEDEEAAINLLKSHD
jgi:type I restriction enzyme M protein